MKSSDNSRLRNEAATVAATALSRFRRILENNNRIIERIGRLEQALGGEYIFDQAFLHTSLEQLAELVREVVYSLNALAGQRYPGLYERFTAITNHLADLATGGPGPYDSYLALPYRVLHRDLDYLVGNKNAILAEIANQLKMPTPDGFALTATAYQRCLDQDGLAERISAVLAGEGDNPTRSAIIAGWFEDFELPDELREALAEELAALKRRQPWLTGLAVRSSAVGEDGERSFAGQFRTILGVTPDQGAVEAAYRKLLASRFAAPVLDYLGATISPREIPMAVAVQPLVPALIAGVLYTRDPVQSTGDHLVVGAVPGSGSKLVDGSSVADRYQLFRRHPFTLQRSEIQARSADQLAAAGIDPLSLTENGRRRGSALLTPAELRTLAEIGLLLEKTFDGPQDIEWAWNEQGPLLLQCRPLALPVRQPPPPETVAAELKLATVLLRGHGQVAQLGIATGPVVLVSPGFRPQRFSGGRHCRGPPSQSPLVAHRQKSRSHHHRYRQPHRPSGHYCQGISDPGPVRHRGGDADSHSGTGDYRRCRESDDLRRLHRRTGDERDSRGRDPLAVGRGPHLATIVALDCPLESDRSGLP